jgi:hypothetical protein
MGKVPVQSTTLYAATTNTNAPNHNNGGGGGGCSSGGGSGDGAGGSGSGGKVRSGCGGGWSVEVPFVVVGRGAPPSSFLVTLSDGTSFSVPVANSSKSKSMGDDEDGRLNHHESGVGCFDGQLAAAALGVLLEKARVGKVAAASSSQARSSSSPSSSSSSSGTAVVARLAQLIDSFEARTKEAAAAARKKEEEGKESVANGGGVLAYLSRSSPKARVAVHKATSRTLQGLRELRNDLAAIEAHRSTDSSSQVVVVVVGRDVVAAVVAVCLSMDKQTDERKYEKLTGSEVPCVRVSYLSSCQCVKDSCQTNS